jgi:hypothetical protein
MGSAAEEGDGAIAKALSEVISINNNLFIDKQLVGSRSGERPV